MKSEKGFSLIETIASLGILGIIGVGLLGALAVSSRATITMEERQTAANLAETQMEYVKSQTYQAYGASYELALVLSGYPDYAVTTDTDAVPALSSGNIQKITVTVIRQDRTILELEDYKVR